MQKLAIYSAHSLVEVITHLESARPSGVLTIWRAADPQREEASLLVEAGQLLRLRWGSYEGEVTGDLLHQLTLWGAIAFVFRLRETVPLLPPPSYPSSQEQPRSPVPVTHPLPVPASSLRPKRLRRAPPSPGARGRTPGMLLPQVGETQPPPVAFAPQPGSVSEFTVPTLTETARSYPMLTLPRHDRAVLLLVDGRRSIADIARLTTRTSSSVRASLARLREQQLLDVLE